MMARATYACARCAKQKRKCDGGSPACSRCIQAGVLCTGLNRTTKIVQPRSFVKFLEQTIASLEVENNARQARVTDQASSGPNHLELTLTDVLGAVSTTAATSMIGPFQRTIESFRHSCLLALAATPSALPKATRKSSPSAIVRNERQVASQANSVTLQSIPTHVADMLVKIYIEKILPQYPFFSEKELNLHHMTVYHTAQPASYRPPSSLSRSEFIIAMVMAVSVMTSKASDTQKPASLSESLHQFALSRYDSLAETSITNLQCVMLLCQFANFCPMLANVWQLKGTAVRMATSLGLHRDVQLGNTLEENTVSQRRQIFWVLYSMDRSISITALRHYSIADEFIDTKFPWPVQDRSIGRPASTLISQRAQFLNHVTFRQIQSEIYAVNFLLKEPAQSYREWMELMDAKLVQWREDTRPFASAGFDWFHLALYTAQLYLHVDCPRNPRPGFKSVLIGFEIANGVAEGYLKMIEGGLLKFDWHCAHQAVTASTLLLRILRTDYQTLLHHHENSELVGVLEKFTELFQKLSKRWPQAYACLELFESLKKDLFQSFRMSADFLSLAEASRTQQQSDSPVHASADNVNIDPTLPQLDPSHEDRELWEQMVNAMDHYTEMDWNLMATDTGFHWAF